MAYTSFTVVSATSGAANTKGAYTEITASTPYDGSRLYLLPSFTGASVRFILLDIATGAASAETVIVENIALVADPDAIVGEFISLDVDIPTGTRLSMRVQSPTASTTFTIGCLLEDRSLASLANPVTYGTNLASSRGTQADPGTTINTKGSYVQFSASTANQIDTLLICITVAQQAVVVATALSWLIDIATGASTAEVVIIPDIYVAANTANDRIRPSIIRFPVSIPAGTRLAVRCSCTLNTAITRVPCFTLIGMQEPATTSGGATSVAYIG